MALFWLVVNYAILIDVKLLNLDWVNLKLQKIPIDVELQYLDLLYLWKHFLYFLSLPNKSSTNIGESTVRIFAK